jgi:hypothetical protein
MLMASSMTLKNNTAIWLSISLNLDENILCAKRVEMSWYESDLVQIRGSIYRVVVDKI